ncbi:putative polysaccharide export protein [Burkholderia thailandensis]|uniref:Polysaccharide export protein n=1 Tax=Burkholderia thailandensis TaxID=57975 RepID=A0AAW9CWH8_BURTH|nr:putative polysaccharide export protein [Burkholderia thailandensis]
MGAITLAGCSSIPTSGASSAQITRAAESPSGIQIVDVTEDVARQLFADRNTADFVTALGDGASFRQQLGVGDTIQVSIWEAPPATLLVRLSRKGVRGRRTRA